MQNSMIKRLLLSFLPAILILFSCQTSWAFIYTLSDSNGLKLNQYNELTGDFIKTLQTPPNQIPNSIFSGPNNYLYTVTQNIGPMGAITRYDGVTGAFVDYFTSEKWGVGGQTMFGPNGNIYSRGNYDQMYPTQASFIHKIDGNTGAVIQERFISFPRSSSSAFFDFGPDGNIVVGHSQGISVFSATTGAMMGQLPLPGCDNLIMGPNYNMYGLINNQVVKYEAWDTGYGLSWKPPVSFATAYGFMRFGPDGNLYVVNAALGKLSQYNGQTGAYVKDMFSFTPGQNLTFAFAGGTPVVTPEPASMVLFGLGGAAMAFARRRMKA